MLDFTDWTEEMKEDFEERAGIIEHEVGYIRSLAEDLAYRIVMRKYVTKQYNLLDDSPDMRH